MGGSSKKDASRFVAERANEEHERLLLRAASVIPAIIRDEVQRPDTLRQCTLEYIEKHHKRDELEKWISDGKIKDAKQQAAWRTALQNPPILPLALADVEFGHSFFSAERGSSYGPASRQPAKRLGTVDLAITWDQPRQGRLALSWDWGREAAIDNGVAAFYALDNVRVRAYAIAFPSKQSLGHIIAALEEADDWIRVDCVRRVATESPVIAVVNREEVFDAICTRHDTICIGESNVDYALPFTSEHASDAAEHGAHRF